MSTITYTAKRKIIAAHTQTELVTNGSFSADTNWTKGTGWTISGGLASHASGTAADLSQAISITAGTTYKVVFTVYGLTTGTVTAKLGTAAGSVISSNGTYTQYIIAAGSATLFFSASSTFNGSLDNVSVMLTDVWTKEFNLISLAQRFDNIKSEFRSLGGTIVTRGIRQEEGWSATTKALTKANLPEWTELFASVGYGEQFYFDAYGTIATPDNVQAVKLDGEHSVNRIGNRDLFNISFTLKVA